MSDLRDEVLDIFEQHRHVTCSGCGEKGTCGTHENYLVNPEGWSWTKEHGLRCEKCGPVRWCYSADGERYEGDYETREEALTDLIEAKDGSGDRTGFLAIAKRVTFNTGLMSERLAQEIEEQAYDQVGEAVADNIDFTAASVRLLEGILECWIEDNVKVHCFGVDKIEEIEVPELDEG